MNRILAFLVIAIASIAPSRADSPDGCDGVPDELQAPLAALRKPAIAIAAHTNIQAAGMPLALDEHYLVTLTPQNQVAFIVLPTRPARGEHPHGGILYFDVEESGRYRFSLDTGHWIDVIDSGDSLLDGKSARHIESVAHVDGDECTLLHKSVAFDLQAGITYRVHLSGRDAARVNIVVTREVATKR